MKSIREYLSEIEAQNWYNRQCYSQDMMANVPKENCEKEFEECVRNGEIIVALIEMYESCEKTVSK